MNSGQQKQFNRVKRNLPDLDIDLIGHQIGPSIVDKEGMNILSVAIESNNQEVFDMIMDLPDGAKRAFALVPDEKGRHPVEVAFESDNTYFLEALLKADATLVNQQNTNTGIGLLHRLARHEAMGLESDIMSKRREIVESASPDRSIRNNRGETPQETVNRLFNIRFQQVPIDFSP